ncbi:MAG: ATP-dependent 6-phosphofructokinase [Deltaproteobacteria bacterium]|nr:ATP-dependent 6-phosphofructokinase [Deltaproteobacteria bacterium]
MVTPKKRAGAHTVGILTSGGDCPGLNAAIRAVTKSAIHRYGMRVVGILDGFRGLVENRTVPLDGDAVSGILTRGGTILGTSRDKPHKMRMGDRVMDMTATAAENARRLQLDCVVCLGGGGTQKNAWRLARQHGLHVVTLPKTIDNDVVETDVSFGFDTAMSVATEAIDRLHTTATSHHRIIVCEVMGHRAGWLALGAGLAGGADVILLPEIPYDLATVANFLLERRRQGRRFSIVVVAEGARSKAEVAAVRAALARSGRSTKGKSVQPGDEVDPAALIEDETRDDLPVVVRRIKGHVLTYHMVQEPLASRIARQLQELTGTEARVTSLGHVQRGGVPTAFDRMLCTVLGTRATELAASGKHGVMVAYRAGRCEPVPLRKVVGRCRTVPLDHPWILSARMVNTCLGDGAT